MTSQSNAIELLIYYNFPPHKTIFDLYVFIYLFIYIDILHNVTLTNEIIYEVLFCLRINNFVIHVCISFRYFSMVNLFVCWYTMQKMLLGWKIVNLLQKLFFHEKYLIHFRIYKHMTAWRQSGTTPFNITLILYGVNVLLFLYVFWTYDGKIK